MYIFMIRYLQPTCSDEHQNPTESQEWIQPHSRQQLAAGTNQLLPKSTDDLICRSGTSEEISTDRWRKCRPAKALSHLSSFLFFHMQVLVAVVGYPWCRWQVQVTVWCGCALPCHTFLPFPFSGPGFVGLDVGEGVDVSKGVDGVDVGGPCRW